MKVWSRTMWCIGVLALVCAGVIAEREVASAAAQNATSRMVAAANALLSSLDEKQRQKVLYSYDDEKQRATWSNLPVTMVARGGISLKEMKAAQQSAAMALVAAALSPRGYEKVQQIVEGDEVLKRDMGHAPAPTSNVLNGPSGQNHHS